MALELEMKVGPEVGPNADALTALTRGRGPRRGNLEDLLKYWRPIMKKPGGFRRCVATLIDKPQFGGQPQRICAWLHHELTGKWPNEGNHHGGRGGRGGRKKPRSARSRIRRVVSSKKSFSSVSSFAEVSSLRDLIRNSRDINGVLVQPINGRQEAVDFKAAIFTQHLITSSSEIYFQTIPQPRPTTVEEKTLFDSTIGFKRVGIFGANSRVGQVVQGAGSMLLPGDLSDFRSPVRSQIYETLTPGGGGTNLPSVRRLLRRGTSGARNKFRCPPGYENGGTFTDSEFSTCGAQILAIPSVGPGSPTASALRSLARLSGTAGLVQEIGDLRNNIGAIDIIRAAQIPQAPKKGSPTRAQTSIDLVLDRYMTEDFPTKVVRRDGVILDPVVPMETLGNMVEFDDMADGSIISRYVDGPIGLETLQAFSTGLRNVFVAIPDVGAVKISRVGGEITDEERSGLAGVFVSRDPDMPDPSELVRGWANDSDGRFSVEFGLVSEDGYESAKKANDLIRVQTAGGKTLTVPRWVYETFLSRGAPRRPKDGDIFEIIKDSAVEDVDKKKFVSPFMLSHKSNFADVYNEFMVYNLEVSSKAANFKSMSDTEVKIRWGSGARRARNTLRNTGRAVGGRSSAIFDPGINRYRCPPGTRYGGRISDQFGTNCGYSLPRGVVDDLVSLRSIVDAPDSGSRRGVRRPYGMDMSPSRRKAEQERLGKLQGILDKVVDEMGDVFKKTEGREAGRLGRTISEDRSDVSLTPRDQELLEGSDLEKALSDLRDALNNMDLANADLDTVRKLYNSVERAANTEAGRLTDKPPRSTPDQNRSRNILDILSDIIKKIMSFFTGGAVDDRDGRDGDRRDTVAPSGESPRRPQGGTGRPRTPAQERRPRTPAQERRPRQPQSDSTPSGGIPDLNRFTVSGGPPYDYPGLPAGNYTRNRDGSVTNLDTGQVFDMVDTGGPETFGGSRRFRWTARQGDTVAPSGESPRRPQGGTGRPTRQPGIVSTPQRDSDSNLDSISPQDSTDLSDIDAQIEEGELGRLSREFGYMPPSLRSRRRGEQRSSESLNNIMSRFGPSDTDDSEVVTDSSYALTNQELDDLLVRIEEFDRAAAAYETRGGGMTGVFLRSLNNEDLDRHIETFEAATAVFRDNPEFDDLKLGLEALKGERRRRDLLGAAVGSSPRVEVNSSDELINILDEINERARVYETSGGGRTGDFLRSVSDNDIGVYINALEQAYDLGDEEDRKAIRDMIDRLYGERSRRKNISSKPNLDAKDIDSVFNEMNDRWNIYQAWDNGAEISSFISDLPDDDLLKFRNALHKADNIPSEFSEQQRDAFNLFRSRLDNEFDKRFKGDAKRPVEHLDGLNPDEKFDVDSVKDRENALVDFYNRMEAFETRGGGLTQDFLRSLNDRDLAFYEGILTETLEDYSMNLPGSEEDREALQEILQRLTDERQRRGDMFNPRPTVSSDIQYLVSNEGRIIPNPIDDPYRFTRYRRQLDSNVVNDLNDMDSDTLQRVVGAAANEYADLTDFWNGELGGTVLTVSNIRRHIEDRRDVDPAGHRLRVNRFNDFRELNDIMNSLEEGRLSDKEILQDHLARMSSARIESILGLRDNPNSGVSVTSSPDVDTPDTNAGLYDQAIDLYRSSPDGSRYATFGVNSLVQFIDALEADDRPDVDRDDRVNALNDLNDQLRRRLNPTGNVDDVLNDLNNIPVDRFREMDNTVLRAYQEIIKDNDTASGRLIKDIIRNELANRSGRVQSRESLRDRMRGLFNGGAGDPDSINANQMITYLDYAPMEEWPNIRRSIRQEIMDMDARGEWNYNTPAAVYASRVLAAGDRKFNEDILQLNIDIPERPSETIQAEIDRINLLTENITDLDTIRKLEDTRRVLQRELARRNLGASLANVDTGRGQMVDNINFATANSDAVDFHVNPFKVTMVSSDRLVRTLEGIDNNPNLSSSEKDYYGGIIKKELEVRGNFGSFEVDEFLQDRSDGALREYADYLRYRINNGNFSNDERAVFSTLLTGIEMEQIRRVAAGNVVAQVDANPSLVRSIRDAVNYDWRGAWQNRLEKRRQALRDLIKSRYGDSRPFDFGGIEALGNMPDAEIASVIRQTFSDGVEVELEPSIVTVNGVQYRRLVRSEITDLQIYRDRNDRLSSVEVTGVNNFILRPVGATDNRQDIVRRGSPGSHISGGFRRELTWGYDEDGNLIRSKAYHANLGFKLDVPVVDSSGRPVLDSNGEQIKVAFNGGGAANKFNDNAALWYKGMGINSYDVTAANDGPSVWARQGYRDTAAYRIEGLNRDMENLLENYNGYVAAVAAGVPASNDQKLAKIIVKDNERADRLYDMLVPFRNNADTNDMPGHHDFLIALDGPNGERNTAAFEAFLGNAFPPDSSTMSQDEVSALLADNPNLFDNLVPRTVVADSFVSGRYDLNELFTDGWDRDDTVPDVPSSIDESIFTKTNVADRWNYNPNRRPLAPGDNRNGALDPVPEGANGITSEADAVRALADGADIMDIPDNFVAQAIFWNSDHPNTISVGQRVTNPRYRFFGASPSDPGAGINLRENRSATIPGGMTIFQDTVTGQYYGFKGFGGVSFGENEAIGEVVGRMLQERFGLAAGQIRWDGEMPDNVQPIGRLRGRTRGIVVELAQNYLPEEAFDINNDLRFRQYDEFRSVLAREFPGESLTDILAQGTRDGRISGVEIEDLVGVALMDILIINSDRHGENFGMYVDPDTRKLRVVAFDNGVGMQGVNDFAINFVGNRPPDVAIREIADLINEPNLLPVINLIDRVNGQNPDAVKSAILNVLKRFADSEDSRRLYDDMAKMETDADMDLDNDAMYLRGFEKFSERYEYLLDLARQGDYDAIMEILGF